jgi:hypothetical protein
VLPGVVAYTNLPSLAAVSLCWWDDFLGCGRHLPIPLCGRGDSHHHRPLLHATGHFTRPRHLHYPILCDQLRSSLRFHLPHTYHPQRHYLTCGLPSVNRTGILGQALTVGTTWSDGYSTNQLSRYIYNYPNPPRILSVQGFGMSGDLSSGLGLQGCQQGEMITLRHEPRDCGWLAGAVALHRPSTRGRYMERSTG